jgi:aminoglycoside phosphotransferase (APT) family kinase protein
MRTLRQQVPVPDVYAEGSWHDRPALLLAWCAGTTLLSAVRAQPWRVWQLGVAMGRIHAQIHAAPIPDWLADALPSISATDMRASILHLDYHPLNIMCTRQGISGVLDWANAAQGDRRADLARTITLLRLAPAPPRSPALLLSVLRRLLEAAWRSGYCQLHPADAFDHLEPFYAWAGDWMERDLRPKLGRPGVWLTERDLDRIHRWTLAHARS